MLYPIYDYYHESSLTLEEVLQHYVEKFYYRKHGRDKFDKILKKLSDSNKVRSLFDESYQKRLALSNVDFGATINEMMWFMFQSNETQAVAVLAMALSWHTNVNSHLYLKTERELRDDALMIFKKFQIYGDMTQEEYDSMRHPEDDEVDEVDDEEYDNVIEDEGDFEEGVGYHILNFYLDCSYWHRQEDEIKKCPLILPVKIIDVDEEDDVVFKYNVRNLPTLILVDGNGNEIHRWVGITETSEINDYITVNGYDEKEYEDVDVDEDVDDVDDEDKNKAHIRSTIRKGLEDHMAKTMQEHGDLMNDPFTGGLMVEAAIGTYFNSLKNQNALYIIASHFGVDLDSILDEETKRALSKYLK